MGMPRLWSKEGLYVLQHFTVIKVSLHDRTLTNRRLTAFKGQWINLAPRKDLFDVVRAERKGLGNFLIPWAIISFPRKTLLHLQAVSYCSSLNSKLFDVRKNFP
jgi:hypothetical protein